MDSLRVSKGHIATRRGRLLLNAKFPGFPGTHFVDILLKSRLSEFPTRDFWIGTKKTRHIDEYFEIENKKTRDSRSRNWNQRNIVFYIVIY